MRGLSVLMLLLQEGFSLGNLVFHPPKKQFCPILMKFRMADKEPICGFAISRSCLTSHYRIYLCLILTFFPVKSTFKFTILIIRGFHCLVKKTKQDKSFAVIGV